MSLSIAHEESGHRGAFYYEQDGKRLAEMTYSRANASLVIIDHTEVDASLGGKGVGRQLLDAAVKWARETHTKVVATCRLRKHSSKKIRRFGMCWLSASESFPT